MYLNILSDYTPTQWAVLAIVQKVLEDTELAETITAILSLCIDIYV